MLEFISPKNKFRFFVSYHSRKVIRHIQDQTQELCFALEKNESHPLPYTYHKHHLPLYRQLKNVPAILFENKKTNHSLALKNLNKIEIHPGQTFSFWKCIGKPSKEKGYLPGLVLNGGKASIGIGGGLCQLANLIYWLALHTDLKVTEKHRHSFDIFSDSERKIPAGTGATVVYNYKDLRLFNSTDFIFQLSLSLSDTHLCGEILSNKSLTHQFQIEEKEHEFIKKSDGWYRTNKIFRLKKDLQGNTLTQELISDNYLKCQYDPTQS